MQFKYIVSGTFSFERQLSVNYINYIYLIKVLLFGLLFLSNTWKMCFASVLTNESPKRQGDVFNSYTVPHGRGIFAGRSQRTYAVRSQRISSGCSERTHLQCSKERMNKYICVYMSIIIYIYTYDIHFIGGT